MNETTNRETGMSKITWNTTHGMNDQRGSVARVNGWRYHRTIERFATIASEAVFSVEVYAPGATASDEIWTGMTAANIDATITARAA
jgi:hypothetical protein